MKNPVCLILMLILFTVNDSKASSAVSAVFDRLDDISYKELMADGLEQLTELSMDKKQLLLNGKMLSQN